MKKWLQEPLLQFLIIGGLLFTAYGWLNQGKSPEESRVVRITEAEVNWLKEVWTRQWHRAPNEQELRGLVADHLKEELLAREARAMGMEENDTVVRRRLAQKMEFLIQDTARLDEPSESELRALYETNRERYRTPESISFTQIFFKTEAAARRSLQDLAGTDGSKAGDASLLERQYRQADVRSVIEQFGPTFADALTGLKTGEWYGPLTSAYGYHLVRIQERHASADESFEKVQAQVLTEWRRLEEIKANDRFFGALLKKYNIVIEDAVRPLAGSFAAPKER